MKIDQWVFDPSTQTRGQIQKIHSREVTVLFTDNVTKTQYTTIIPMDKLIMAPTLMDTTGSIPDQMLEEFHHEIRGIMDSAYGE